jgi:hypothetical protein
MTVGASFSTGDDQAGSGAEQLVHAISLTSNGGTTVGVSPSEGRDEVGGAAGERVPCAVASTPYEGVTAGSSSRSDGEEALT